MNKLDFIYKRYFLSKYFEAIIYQILSLNTI